jgi:hypothetical protein
MSRFFTRERFGQPQFIAGLLLLVFLGQCLWLIKHGAVRGELEAGEMSRIIMGLSLWERKQPGWTAYAPLAVEPDISRPSNQNSSFENAGDPNHSPLWYLIASAPFAFWQDVPPRGLATWIWLARIPYLIFGVVLGASLWYVARRLYGNAGGYIALGLYCFAPGFIRASAMWFAQPETGAAWGAFGAIFTAIAVAHTLYAPREVVLWNWRRIVLLALSLALAVGSQFSLIVTVPLALVFMLYLASTRRAAALAIWGAACVIAFLLLFASYGFRPSEFWQGMRHARFLGILWPAFGMSGAYRQVAASLGQMSPALVLAFPVTLIFYIAWPRTRYFGNTAPLLVSVLFLLLALATPHYPGWGFLLMAVPFLFVFVAGIFADLLETRQRSLVMACLWGLLAANALWSLMELARVPRG